MSKWDDTCKYFPEGIQTLSKRPCVHLETYPKYIMRGEGPYVFDENGRRYIDFPCSLGALILGHGNERILKAVLEVLKNGSLFSLPNPKETELAKLINTLIPSMEMMRFVKTGSESCSAAVKIARAYTGRDPIICCGYMGWHNWYSQTTPKNAGTVKQDVTQIPWGHVKTLEKLIKEKKPAAFITEPYVLQEDEALIEKYLKTVRRICTENKVVLIFDENVTGFRTRKLAAQNYWKVKPDLTCLGKAMANGIPMACVGGKREIMQVLISIATGLKIDDSGKCIINDGHSKPVYKDNQCFVSSTFGGDLIGITAAIETIDQMKHSAATEHIWQMGSKLKGAFNQSAKSLMINEHVKCIGLPPRTKFLFPTPAHLGLFWQETLRQGIFFGYAQFITTAHRQYEMDLTSAAIRSALKIVKKNWDNPSARLQGPPPQETLRDVVLPVGKKAGSALDTIKQGPEKGEQPAQKPEIRKPPEVTNRTETQETEDKPVPATKKKEKPTCAKCGSKHWAMHKCK